MWGSFHQGPPTSQFGKENRTPQVVGNVTSGDKIPNSGAREACESRYGAQFLVGERRLDQLGTLVDDGYHSVPLG